MQWTKLGQIFDPANHRLPGGCRQFAQSPQALVFDGFVRIYFSTRAVDPSNGKFLSHVAFVDMAKDFKRVLRVSDRPVIPLGALGAFDEHGIFPMNVVRHEGRVLGYTCGWNRRVSVSVDTAIGLAVSEDEGLSFRRIGDGPVLGPTLHEPFLVGDPFVLVDGGLFHMWYIFGTSWERFEADASLERVYKIGHATSRDGLEWRKEEGRRIVADRLHANESQALPSVVRIGKRWHMFFCYRESSDFRKNPSRSYRIGHAWSDDAREWVRDDDAPGLDASPDGWDSEMLCYPHAFRCDGNVYLLYNGNEFGRHGFGIAVLH
jgi:hypothetical protein